MSGKNAPPSAQSAKPHGLPSQSSRSARAGLQGAVLDAKCLLLLYGMRIAISTLGYARIRRHLPRPAARDDSHFWGRQMGRRIERMARFVPWGNCLTQALALQYVLGRAGHASNLQVGVRQSDQGQFSAHAWVTCNGRVVLGQSGTRLHEFTRLAELG